MRHAGRLSPQRGNVVDEPRGAIDELLERLGAGGGNGVAVYDIPGKREPLTLKIGLGDAFERAKVELDESLVDDDLLAERTRRGIRYGAAATERRA